MSSGVLRKQYQALAALAENLAIDFTTPSGSFNEKFCELCRVMIVDLGGAFTPVTGGSFLTRKATYLRQLAVALGITTTEAGTSFRETFLKSAFAINDLYSDGETPDYSSSFDWRVYQYLLHATQVGPADRDSLVRWLYDYDGGLIPFLDYVTPRLDSPEVVGVNVLDFNGVDGDVEFTCAIGTTWDISLLVDLSQIVNGQCVFSKGAAAGTSSDVVIDYSSGAIRGFFYSGTSPSLTSWPLAQSNAFVMVRYINTGTAQSLSFDGVVVIETTYTDVPNTAGTTAHLGNRFGFNWFAGRLALLSTDCTDLSLGEGQGIPAYDSSGNGNHGTISGGATWTTADGIDSDHLSGGFDLWTKDVGGDKLYVSLQSDGTSVKGDGDTITGYTWQSKHVGSSANPCTHNGFEGGLRETDAWFSDPANIPNRYNDGSGVTAIYWADILAHLSGHLNSYQAFDEQNGNCRLTKLGQYPISPYWSPTPSQYSQNVNYWKQGNCGAGFIEPVTYKSENVTYNSDLVLY